MVITRKIHRINANTPKLPEGNFLAQRIGFWGLVIEQNSINNTVTVVSDTGFQYENVPVVSGEWVTVDENKDYIPSQRNLPPKNSRVFVLTPTYSAMGAFVLCSGFSKGDENIRTLWAQNNNELEDKNNCRETKTQGGWDITEEYSNGNYSAVSNDNNIKFNVNTTKDDNKSQPKEVSVLAWGNKIIIDENGIKITDKNNNEIAATSSGIKITDANNNVIETKSSGVSVTDKTGNKIVTSATNVEVYGKLTNKLKLGNDSGTIYDILSDLITKLNSGLVVTAGSATAQSITSGQFSTELTKLGLILE